MFLGRKIEKYAKVKEAHEMRVSATKQIEFIWIGNKFRNKKLFEIKTFVKSKIVEKKIQLL